MTTITFELPVTLAQAIDAVADEEQRSKATVYRRAFAKEIHRVKWGGPGTTDRLICEIKAAIDRGDLALAGRAAEDFLRRIREAATALAAKK